MNEKLTKSIFLLLRPLVSLLNNNGVAFGDFSKLAKQAYIIETEKELLRAGEKPTTSKIAIITGLTRKDVAALRTETFPKFEKNSQKNRSIRVISGWISDKEFCESEGSANVLPLRGESGSFEILVKRYSGDITAPSMLDELLRIKVVTQDENKNITLLKAAYISSDDDNAKYENLGEDVNLLISTIKHNISNKNQPPRFQRKVSYDKIPWEYVEEFRAIANQYSQALLVKLNGWLAKHDVDREPNLDNKNLHKIGVGLYYFEEKQNNDVEEDDSHD